AHAAARNSDYGLAYGEPIDALADRSDPTGALCPERSGLSRVEIEGIQDIPEIQARGSHRNLHFARARAPARNQYRLQPIQRARCLLLNVDAVAPGGGETRYQAIGAPPRYLALAVIGTNLIENPRDKVVITRVKV